MLKYFVFTGISYLFSRFEGTWGTFFFTLWRSVNIILHILFISWKSFLINLPDCTKDLKTILFLGITSFNLMGEFGRLDWLANYQLVLFYNLLFEASTSICLFTKFTKTLRDAIFSEFRNSSMFFSLKWKNA